MQSIRIGALDEGQRLDKFLQKYLKEAEKGFLYKMLRKKNITLNGQKADGSEKLCAGDEVKLFFSEETFAKLRGGSGQSVISAAAAEGPGGNEKRRTAGGAELSAAAGRLSMPESLKIVYEDEQVIFLNKPAGMLTQKAKPEDVSLNDHLSAYLAGKGSGALTFTPGAANRLDRNTSGLVVAGKALPGQQLLAQLLGERSLGKYYRALVYGHVTMTGRLVNYLTKDGSSNEVNVCDSSAPGRERVEIGIRPAAYYGEFTLLEVQLVTGKTHQIRAQLAHRGWPVLGDPKYGDAAVNSAFIRRYAYPLRHQLLHAYEIVFPDVLSEESRAKLSVTAAAAFDRLAGKHFIAPLPLNFKKCTAFLGGREDAYGR